MTKTRPQISSRPQVGDSFEPIAPIPATARPLERKHEIVFWEEENPRSLINMVSDKLRARMRELPPELLLLGEDKLKRRVRPGWVLEQLRASFWDEYFLTTDNDLPRMRMAAVFGPICSKETFLAIVESPPQLAYMLQPPSDYMYKMRAMLEVGLERFFEILQLPVKDPDGRVNTRLISEMVKIVALVDNRVKGAVAQKIQIDQKSLNVNVNQGGYEAPKSAFQLEKELKEIERELRKLGQGEQEQLIEAVASQVEVKDGE